jgi:2-polyprenyl-3-methyl-5-hydroxy-6-metoxy-1,4-benzoquinol methylase/predicted transcriptional regulator
LNTTVGQERAASVQEEAATTPSLDLFFETVHAFYRTETLKAAIQLELFTAIGEGADTIEAIAQRCNASERGIRILCNFLVLMGFLKKENTGRYSLTRDPKAFLDKRSQFYVGGAIEFLLSPTQTEGFRDLTSVVRKGMISLPAGGVLAPEHPVWVTFARSMMPILGLPAELLASMLRDLGPKPMTSVLDVAAGHGLFGIAIAKLNPDARISALDWPNVLTVAQENAIAAGIEKRFSTLPGNALELPLREEAYDLVLIPNFLHHLDAETIERFLSKVHRTLKPGGTVAILEFIPNEDRISPPVAVMFSVMMLGITPAGDAYTFSDYDRILRGVGFSKVELHQLPPTYFQVVIAKK